MKNQNYQNHKKFYPPHHFIYLPLLFILQILGIWKIFKDETNQLIWILFSVIIFLFIYLAFMLRQHYALGNQNRIVRLEFRLRYFELFGKSSDEIETRLSFGQLAALRFAYDDEFKDLLEKSVAQNISADEIKKSITHWKPDNNRI